MADHLHGLGVQAVTSLGVLLEVILGRPLALRRAPEEVEFLDIIPQACRLHLRFAQRGLHARTDVRRSMDDNTFHEEHDSIMATGLQAGKTRWTHYQTGYHLVWIPKYRRKVLVGAVADATKRLLQECRSRQGLTLVAAETDINHVHVFVSAPPRWSPAQIANVLKGYTSRYLREEFPHLKQACGQEQLWTQAYYVGTAGQVSVEIIRHYIDECQGK